MKKRMFLACLSLGLSGAARAQEWLQRPIRIVSPFPPGGSTDQVARVLATHLSLALGQKVIVENKAGASGAIGTAMVAKAPADGSTFLLAFDTHAVNPALYPNLGYDTLRDFAPVSLLGTSPLLIAAHPSSPFQSLAQLVAQAKKSPGVISYGSPGSGSLAHLAMTLLQKRGGFELTHVPYKGGGPLRQDAIAGHVPISAQSLFSGAADVNGHLVRPLAVTSARRSPTLPEVPTVIEQGFAGFETSSWWGVLAPGATPKPIVERMTLEIKKVLQKAEVQQNLGGQGITVIGSSPEELAALVRMELSKWAVVVRENGIRAGE